MLSSMNMAVAVMICVEGTAGERRFEFRKETLRVGGEKWEVLALRPTWSGADPELVEFANMKEANLDGSLSNAQLVWFNNFIREVGLEERVTEDPAPSALAIIAKAAQAYLETYAIST